MWRPVCVECATEMRVLKNGVDYIENMVMDGETVPYKIIQCDMFECPICKHRILSGFAQKAYAEHYEDNFKVTMLRIVANGKEGVDWVQERK